MTKNYIDTETTGLAPGQIGQLSLIKQYDNGEIITKNYFFQVKFVEPGAQNVTGRDAAFYRQASGGKTFADYADEIAELLNDGMFVAHNASFDERFIKAEFERVGKTFAPQAEFDTMKYFTDICQITNPNTNPSWKGAYKRPKLEELVNFLELDTKKIEEYAEKLYDIKSNGFHDAMYDTTSMFVAVMRYKDVREKTDAWAEFVVSKDKELEEER